MKDFVGNLYVYCEELYNTNKKLIELVGLDCINNAPQMESIFLFLSCSLMRLVPCNRQNKEKKLALSWEDGILPFKNELSFLENDYNQLFCSHNVLLETIKDVRNKIEHCPHKLDFQSSDSGTQILPIIRFKLQGEAKNWQLNSEDIVSLIKNLNEIFDKIIKELRAYVFTHYPEKQSHPYYQRLCKLDYRRFNHLLESPLLRDISKLMQDF